MKFNKFSVAIFFLFFASNLFAQIGINTITPDSSASLHILSKPNGSGLIIPELTEAQRLAISKPAVGLMVYDVTSKLFYVNLDNSPGNHWYAINPMQTQGTLTTPAVMYVSPVVTKIGIGMQAPQLPQATLDVNGDIHANTAVSTNTLNVNGFPTNALVPAGIITMWSGDPAALPTGWALCDGKTYGTLQTPDLRGRFIVGFDSNLPSNPTVAPADGTTTNYGKPGNSGGETGHVLTKAELPKHQHSIGNGPDGATIDNPGDHVHGVQTRDVGSGSGASDVLSMGWTQGQTTDAAGNHIHSGITGDGTTAGLNNSIHENRPPYYVLAYIIKLP